MGELILITGGARSGKSAFAEKLAGRRGGDRVLFVATAEAGDDEMKRRIEAHRRSRPASWRTLEAPLHVGQAITGAGEEARVILVDCLALLVSNAMFALEDPLDASAAGAAVREEIRGLFAAGEDESADMIVVTNEVGMGLVPDNPLGRLYRDLLGMANRAVAARAHRVYLMVAGLPVDVRRLQEQFGDQT